MAGIIASSSNQEDSSTTSKFEWGQKRKAALPSPKLYARSVHGMVDVVPSDVLLKLPLALDCFEYNGIGYIYNTRRLTTEFLYYSISPQKEILINVPGCYRTHDRFDTFQRVNIIDCGEDDCRFHLFPINHLQYRST